VSGTGSTIAKYCAIVGGICLLIAGITGMAAMDTVRSVVEEKLGIHDTNIHTIFIALILIASLGGIAVIVGGFLIGGSLVRTGKLLIALGAGIGLLGLIIAFLISYYNGNPTLRIGSGLGFTGVILSIVARILA
jgi:hypothetical protein